MFNNLEKKILTILNENSEELFTEYDLVKKLYPNLRTDEVSEFVNKQTKNADDYSKTLLSLSSQNLISAPKIVARDGQPSNLKIISSGVVHLESLTWHSAFKRLLRHPFVVAVGGTVVAGLLLQLILA